MRMALNFTKTLLLATMLAACTSVADTTTQKEGAAQQAPKLSPLHQIFADSDEASLKLSPISALFRGDERYMGEFGDYITDEYVNAQLRLAEEDHRRLQAIDRKSLSPQDQIAYDVFAYQNMMAREGLKSAYVDLTVVRPINHFNGLHAQYQDMNSGKSAAPYKTVKDYDNGLSRMDGFVTFLDRCIGRMKQGVSSGVVETKLTTRQMIKQFDDLIAQGVENSPF